MIKRKDGVQVPTCTITMLDLSHTTIDVTLWGVAAEQEGSNLQQKYYLQELVVLVIKNWRTSKFNGRVITTLSNTSFLIDSKIQETEKIKIWYEQNFTNLQKTLEQLSTTLFPTTQMTIRDIKQHGLTSYQQF